MDQQVLVVIAAVGFWYLATIRAGHIWNGDACMYMIHARNLVHGRPYGQTGYICDPAAGGAPPTYPPVCPALLAPAYKLFGLNLWVMKASMIVCFLVSLFAMSLVFRDRLPPPYLIVAIGVVGFHPYVWDAKDRIGSEFPFLLFTFVSLALIRAAYDAAPSWDNQVRFGLIAGLSMYLAYGTRGLGIVLLPSLVGYHVLQAKRLALFSPFLAIAVGVCVILIVLQHRYVHSESPRVRQLRGRPRSVGGQLLRYGLATYGMWYDRWPRMMHIGLFLMLAAFAGFGYWVAVRDGATVTEVFSLLYLASLMLWPVRYEMRRFLIPALPFLVYYAGVGIAATRALTADAIGTVLGAAMAATLFAWYVTRYARADYGPAPHSITSPAATALYAHVNRETAPQDVFVFYDPRILALFTARRAAAYQQGATDEEMWRFIEEIRATHAVVGPAEKEWFPFFARFVDKYEQYMPPVYRNAEFALHKIAGRPTFRRDHA
jgi:hypothetical protein